MSTNLLRAAVLAALTMSAAACGGGGGDKPTVAEVSTALEALEVPAEMADCIAERIQPELPAATLRSLVDDGKDAEAPVGDADEAFEAVQDASAACLQEGIGQ